MSVSTTLHALRVAPMARPEIAPVALRNTLMLVVLRLECIQKTLKPAISQARENWEYYRHGAAFLGAMGETLLRRPQFAINNVGCPILEVVEVLETATSSTEANGKGTTRKTDAAVENSTMLFLDSVESHFKHQVIQMQQRLKNVQSALGIGLKFPKQ